VVINEFGETGIDDALVRARHGEVALLAGGCLCCTARAGLDGALADLERARREAGRPPFTRLVVETTGLADPAPLVRALASEPALAARWRLACVTVTVDAVNGWRQIDRQPEAVRQVALADRLLLTKTDLAAPADAARLGARLATLNPFATLHKTAMGEVAADVALEAPAETAGRPAANQVAPDHGHRHDADVRAFVLPLPGAVPRAAFTRWLDTLIAHRGDDLLRIKGLVRFDDDARPVLVNAAGALLHPPRPLDAWPGADREGRLVFITRHLPEQVVRESLAAALRREVAQ